MVLLPLLEHASFRAEDVPVSTGQVAVMSVGMSAAAAVYSEGQGHSVVRIRQFMHELLTPTCTGKNEEEEDCVHPLQWHCHPCTNVHVSRCIFMHAHIHP